jgi:hypothetical protein
MRGFILAVLVAGLVWLPAATQAVAATQAAAPAPVAAQKFGAKDQQYLAMVADATNGKDIDWQKLRDLYTQTSFYDPYGGAQAVWYMLQRAGQQTVYDPSPEARQEYNNLLAQHFAHFRSHMQALDMIEKGHLPASERNFHQKALSAITAAITATGDGKTPETAFRVIDPAEETMLLKTYFHFNLDGQEFQQKQGHFWDVLNYTNPSNNEKGSLYFNVDEILTAPGRSASR